MKNIKINKDIANAIILSNEAREEKTLSKYANLSCKAHRFKSEKIPDNLNIRQAYFHDTDKIIHSLTYTRYIDKTQVFYPFENDNITHRVLHVQLVSKIARVIGRALKLNEDLIEAISLGHDLGHVPFGHNGEKKLNEITLREGNECFCHNVQSVRSLQYLENKGLGLNMTMQVLDGILCHNGELMLKEYLPNYEKTPLQFQNEYEKCWSEIGYDKKIISSTLEGCVMRISDVIAYIGRDLEDAITLGFIKREDIPSSVTNTIGNSNSSIINNIVIDLINNSYSKDRIKLSDSIFDAIKEFYSFSKDKIYENPKKTTQDYKIDRMFEVLFERYMNDLISGSNLTSISKIYLPEMNRDYRNKTPHYRLVCDYIAGMTDDYFKNEYVSFLIPKSFGYRLKD